LPFHVTVVDRVTTDEIPGRFGDASLRELLAGLGGEVADDEPAVDAVARTFAGLGDSELAERLLESLLTEPPIPAYCDALVRAMQDPATPPWRTHELRGDRVWLWVAHRLLALARPERFPAPTVERLRLEVVPRDAAARPPGRRTPAHDRIAFVASLLQGRPGALTVEAVSGPDGAFDVLWSVEVGERRPLSPEEAAARGAPVGAVATVVDAWIPGDALGALAAGDAWVVGP
jgi:hypothetical protein